MFRKSETYLEDNDDRCTTLETEFHKNRRKFTELLNNIIELPRLTQIKFIHILREILNITKEKIKSIPKVT